MTRYIYVIRDDVSRQLSPPFWAASQTDAERTYLGFLRSDSAQIQNPADYSLFCLCSCSEELDVSPLCDSDDIARRVNGSTVNRAAPPVEKEN